RLAAGSLFAARSPLGAFALTACFRLSSPRLSASVAAAAPGGCGRGAPGPRGTRAPARSGRTPSPRATPPPRLEGAGPRRPPRAPTRCHRLPSASSRGAAVDFVLAPTTRLAAFLVPEARRLAFALKVRAGVRHPPG